MDESNHVSPRRFMAVVGLSWVAMVGFDFLLHGGILASWYVKPLPFLLRPDQAFARIPIGYLSFLLLAILLLWVLTKLQVKDWRRGGYVGLFIGSLVWGTFALALYSISTAPAGLLVAWFVGQSLELGVAGVVAGAGLSGGWKGPLILRILVFVVIMIVVTVALQTLGLAPAIRQK